MVSHSAVGVFQDPAVGPLTLVHKVPALQVKQNAAKTPVVRQIESHI